MALDAELLSLKSAGTYRFERDLSTISNDTTTFGNLRLVVGFSKMGPFNTPNLVTSPAEFIKLYGNIDRSLEKKGSFFHRSALVALNAGPILCLNLLNLDPDLDQVQTKSMSVNICSNNKNTITLPMTSVFNTDKFWYASDESLLNAIDVYLNDNIGVVSEDINSDECKWTNGILHFTNVSRKPISILVKKASEFATRNYEVTLNEWYGEGNVPEYLNGTSYVSDYMVEIYVVSGDFGPALKSEPVPTNVDMDDDALEDGGEILTMYRESDEPYKRFASDIIYQNYFDEQGFIRRDNINDAMDVKLNKFLNLPSVKLLAKYMGSLIPNFVDKLGRNIWIQKLVNDDVNTIGLLCAENVDLLEAVDTDKEIINENIDLIGNNFYKKIVEGGHDEDNYHIPEMKFDMMSYKVDYEDVLQTIQIKRTELIDMGNSDDSDEFNVDTDIITTTCTYIKPIDSTYDKDAVTTLHPYAWLRYEDGVIYDDDIVYTNTSVIEKPGVKAYDVHDSASDNFSHDIESYTEINPLFVEYKVFGRDVFTSKSADAEPYKVKDNEIILDSSVNIKKGDYLVSYWFSGWDDMDEESKFNSNPANSYSRLTRVVEVKSMYVSPGEGLPNKKGAIRVICSDKIFKRHGHMDDMVVKIKTIDNIAERLQWTCLRGFQMRPESMPDGTNERQNKILDMLRENPIETSTLSNLYRTLIDRDYIQWRYLVDTFGNGLEEECKSVYTQLCQGRKSALAIINCPSNADFKKSQDPSFVNKAGSVSVEYIAKGGNLDKNPMYLFSLPSIENGASWGAYYYPYLKISDLSAVKSVPPAAYVSNLYIQKYARANAWAIVAGQKRGVISGNQVIGVEATLIHENRDWLEPVGINSIIWENGVGVEIYANKTAKHTPKSALSSIHVRECCIFIQDNVESILRRYVFEYNTAQTRLEIKTLVDDFLETVKNNSGIYEYRTVMDTSNNTPEVIDNNMGIIDIYIEPVRGLEILAQRLTVMKTGGIAAGFFE